MREAAQTGAVGSESSCENSHSFLLAERPAQLRALLDQCTSMQGICSALGVMNTRPKAPPCGAEGAVGAGAGGCASRPEAGRGWAGQRGSAPLSILSVLRSAPKVQVVKMFLDVHELLFSEMKNAADIPLSPPPCASSGIRASIRGPLLGALD